MSNIAVINPQEHRQPLAAGGRPQAIVPQSMEDAYRLATAVCKAQMAPKGLDTPEKAMVAILHGLEIGLTPMAALQRIAVVNGRPTIWGDGAIGLVRGSGLCEFVKERIDGTGEQMTAICEAKRKGEAEPVARSFSVADAKRAGLWGKQGPWQQYPTRMLAMRARAFCLRDLFADVLGGLYLREEIEDAAPAVTPPSPPRPPAREPAAIEHKPAVETPIVERHAEPVTRTPPVPPKPPAPPQKAEAAAPANDFESIRARFEKAAADAKDADELNTSWEQICGPHEDALLPPDHEELVGIFRRRERDFEP